MENVYKTYKKRGFQPVVEAIQGVSLSVEKNSFTAIVGESGSGKTTLTRLITGIERCDKGKICLNTSYSKGKIGIVYQNYHSSLNPKYSVLQAIEEPLKIQKLGNAQERIHKVLDMMKKVHLKQEYLYTNVTLLSGGEAQRVAIARALISKPPLLVMDEPLSSLDQFTQFSIVKLLKEIKNDLDITLLYITHDLETVLYLCDKIIFLYNGKVELALNHDAVHNIQNKYVKQLFDAVLTIPPK